MANLTHKKTGSRAFIKSTSSANAAVQNAASKYSPHEKQQRRWCKTSHNTAISKTMKGTQDLSTTQLIKCNSSGLFDAVLDRNTAKENKKKNAVHEPMQFLHVVNCENAVSKNKQYVITFISTIEATLRPPFSGNKSLLH